MSSAEIEPTTAGFDHRFSTRDGATRPGGSKSWVIMVVIAANVNMKDTVNVVPLALRTQMMDQRINSLNSSSIDELGNRCLKVVEPG